MADAQRHALRRAAAMANSGARFPARPQQLKLGAIALRIGLAWLTPIRTMVRAGA